MIIKRKLKLFTIDNLSSTNPKKVKKKKKLPQGKSVTWKHLEKARNTPIDPDSSNNALEIAAAERVKRE